MHPLHHACSPIKKFMLINNTLWKVTTYAHLTKFVTEYCATIPHISYIMIFSINFFVI
jgi:hypothetical protein